jgi:hypothetical protein
MDLAVVPGLQCRRILDAGDGWNCQHDELDAGDGWNCQHDELDAGDGWDCHRNEVDPVHEL